MAHFISDEERQHKDEISERFEQMVNEGYVRIELCGHLEHAGNLKGFYLDKTKYCLRFEEETEHGVKIFIDPVEQKS
jgi:hypothetical protein